MNKHTKTYLSLKQAANRAYDLWKETEDEIEWEAFGDLELDCSIYAYENEDKIEWDLT